MQKQNNIRVLEAPNYSAHIPHNM